MNKPNFQKISLRETCFSGLSSYFEESNLELLGREVKFIERSTSRLSAWMFLKLNTCLVKNGKESSLNDLVNDLRDNFGIKLTKQSLDERFNIYGVKLMQKCFESIFEQILASSSTEKADCCPSDSSVFKRVILRDATSFQLPAHLSKFYEGNAGDTTGSVIKIQPHRRSERI